MANAFKKAEAKAKAPGKSATKPETVWVLKDNDPTHEYLSKFVESTKEIKASEAAKDAVKGPLVEACTERWLAHLTEHGGKPGSTMRLVGRDGLSVTFVAKEDKIPCDDETLAQLAALIGERAEELVHEEVSIKFDAAILALPTAKAAKSGDAATVYDWLGDKIGALLSRGVKAGEITQEQADGLIVASKARVITAGYLDAIAATSQGDRAKLEAGLAVVGPIKRHVQ